MPISEMKSYFSHSFGDEYFCFDTTDMPGAANSLKIPMEVTGDGYPHNVEVFRINAVRHVWHIGIQLDKSAHYISYILFG